MFLYTLLLLLLIIIIYKCQLSTDFGFSVLVVASTHDSRNIFGISIEISTLTYRNALYRDLRCATLGSDIDLGQVFIKSFSKCFFKIATCVLGLYLNCVRSLACNS